MEPAETTSKIEIVLKVAVAAATVYAYISQTETMKEMVEGQASLRKAQGLLGANRLYRSLAVFFGKQAIRTEQAYWKVINDV